MVAAFYSKLYWTLLVSFCVMGLCLAFAQPLFSVPDEPAHWQTAHYRIERFFGAEGCVRSVLGSACPETGPCSSVPPFELQCIGELGIYGGVFTYPGVLLSKLILPHQTDSAIRQVQAVMLARLLQGLMVVLCLMRAGFLACRVAPSGVLVLGAFMLSPLVAQQAFGVSSDGVQIAFGICMFTSIVAWERLAWLDLVLFLMLGLCATAKPSLLPCVLPSALAAFWFGRLEASSSQAGVLDVLRALGRTLKPTRTPSVQTLMLWSAVLISAVTVMLSLHHDAQETAIEAVNPNRVTNLAALRARPWLVVEFATHLRYDPAAPDTWVGPLGWLDLQPAAAVMHAFFRIVLIMAAIELGLSGYQLVRTRPPLRTTFARLARQLPPLLVGLTGPVANVLFMTAIMYVLWTRGGAGHAGGVQFRYFIPAVSVTIALIFRALQLVAAAGSEPVTLPPRPSAGRMSLVAVTLAQALVLVLTLPYVARVFVDLASRYDSPG